MIWLLIFCGVIHALEEAKKMAFSNLWLECDSALVCDTFTSRTTIP